MRGYGLGADSAFISTLIGLYVVTLAIGAFTLPLTSRLLGVRRALVVACALVGLGYLLWLPFHDETWQALVNMGIAGLGSGALVAALPAAAAAAAPRRPHQHRHRHDERHQDRRRRDRLRRLRHRAGRHRLARAAGRRSQAPLSGYLTVWAVCCRGGVPRGPRAAGRPPARLLDRSARVGERIREAG